MTVRLTVDGRARRFTVNPMVLGQGPEADWDLGLTPGPARHAQLELRADGRLWIQPLAPRPGTQTWVGGVPIVDATPLRTDAPVTLGPFPAWCRPSATATFMIDIEVLQLDEAHQVLPGPGVPPRLPLPRSDTALAPIEPRPMPAGSVVLTTTGLDRLAALVLVEGDLRLLALTGPPLLIVPVLSEVGGDLLVVGCPGIRRLELPELEAVGGRVVLDGLPDLEEVALPKLSSSGGVTIRGTRWLTTADLPRLAEVRADVLFADNPLLTHVDLPRLERVRRVRFVQNAGLPPEVIEGMRAEFHRRRTDGVVDVADNGGASRDQILRQRLHAFVAEDVHLRHASFERFVRVAPELIEVHERMLVESDADDDRPATIERLRRLLSLAQAQGDDREELYDAALKRLVEPPEDVSALDDPLADDDGLGTLQGSAAAWWTAEWLAYLERPREADVPALLRTWRERGARGLMAPLLDRWGRHGAAAICATAPADEALAWWLWAAVGSAPNRMVDLGPPLTALGRVLTTSSLPEAADAFVDLASAATAQADPSGARWTPVRRAAARWLAADIDAHLPPTRSPERPSNI